MPFPKYALNDEHGRPTDPGSKIPGHGAARVRVNFWFFLFFFYGFYNLTALMWITKVFNLYSLNWLVRALTLPQDELPSFSSPGRGNFANRPF